MIEWWHLVYGAIVGAFGSIALILVVYDLHDMARNRRLKKKREREKIWNLLTRTH